MAEEMRDVRKQFERHATVQLERVVAVVVIVALLLVDRHRFGGEKAHRVLGGAPASETANDAAISPELMR